MNRKSITLTALLLVITAFILLFSGCKAKNKDVSHKDSSSNTSSVSSEIEENSSVPNPDDKIIGYEIIENSDNNSQSESSQTISENSSKNSDTQNNTNTSSDSDEELGDNFVDLSELLG